MPRPHDSPLEPAKLKDAAEPVRLEILETVRRIEDRLIGSLEEERPGLIEEVRELKTDRDALKKEIADLSAIVKGLQEAVTVAKALHEEVKTLRETMESLNKWRWVTYGVLLTLGFLLKNAWEALPFIKKN